MFAAPVEANVRMIVAWISAAMATAADTGIEPTVVADCFTPTLAVPVAVTSLPVVAAVFSAPEMTATAA